MANENEAMMFLAISHFEKPGAAPVRLDVRIDEKSVGNWEDFMARIKAMNSGNLKVWVYGGMAMTPGSKDNRSELGNLFKQDFFPDF